MEIQNFGAIEWAFIGACWLTLVYTTSWAWHIGKGAAGK